MTHDMADFQREERYLVVKISDFHTKQDEESIRAWLQKFGVPTRECVVIEHDWPIYEHVWDMVQRMVEGRPQKLDQQREEALAAHVERLRKASLDAIHYLPGGEIKAELRDAYDDTPETSLTRRDLIKQAEVLEKTQADLYEFPASAGMAMIECVGDKANELRQRAQEATNAPN